MCYVCLAFSRQRGTGVAGKFYVIMYFFCIRIALMCAGFREAWLARRYAGDSLAGILQTTAKALGAPSMLMTP